MSSTSANLTDEQRKAVTARGVSVVLSSGAGCGKTHVLTQRYLSHLEDDGVEVGEIVAITFTERAARQMRRRIRQAIVGHVRAAEDDETAERWARHLRGLETAPISTIHAFCAMLLRQHAVEAGIDPGFDVLEDVLAGNLEGEALNECLQKLLTAQTEAGEDLRHLVLVFGWRAVVDAVASLMRAWDDRPWEGWLARGADEIARTWIEQARRDVLPGYLNHKMRSRPVFNCCLDLLRRCPPATVEMKAQADLLLQGLPRLHEADDLGQTIQELHEAAKVGRSGKKAWPDTDVYEEVKSTFEDVRAALKSLPVDGFSFRSEDEVVRAVEAGQRFGRVVREAVRAYAEKKHAHGVVDFQDLLLRARDLLRDHADVRGRLQERYRFLLIDELQDTDPVQMELIEDLCGAGLHKGKLFAVGDANQSIYRFRGADVASFVGLRNRVPHDGRLDLTLNFRSQPAILDFANELLGRQLSDYRPLKAFHPQVNPGPCVEFLWAEAPEKGDAHACRLAEAENLAARVASMIGRERLVADEEQPGSLRPVRAGDVVLLFRAMTQVHIYEAALRRHGLDYYLVGGRAFFAQQEIYDILNLLRALENPQDGVSLAGTLRSPFCCLSDEALFALSRHREGIWAGLHDDRVFDLVPDLQKDRVLRARRFLDRWRGIKDRLSIARLLGEVFADSGYDAATQFEFLGDRKLANLWKLVDLARTFDRSGLFGLAEFIARLDDLVGSASHEEQAATQPENADVVRLMSIHQAKGLEFPVVVIPDVTTHGGPRYQPVARWAPGLGCVVRPPEEDEPPFSALGWQMAHSRNEMEEWAEDLRTLYVACTRAEDYLILSAALPEKYEPNGPWMTAIAERFELRSGPVSVPGSG